MKFGRVVFEIAYTRADRQADKQTYSSHYFTPSRKRSNEDDADNKRQITKAAVG